MRRSIPSTAASAPSSSGAVEAPVQTLTREPLPAGGRVGDSSDQRGRHRLRVAGAGEPAHPDVVARSDESCGLIGRHQPVIERLAPRSRSVRHPCAPARARSRAGPRSGHPGPAGASGAGALGRAGCDHPTLLRGRGRPAPSPGRAASPGIRGTGPWPPPPGPQPRVPRRRERRAQGRSRWRTAHARANVWTAAHAVPDRCVDCPCIASPDAVLDTRDVSPRSGAARRLLPFPNVRPGPARDNDAENLGTMSAKAGVQAWITHNLWVAGCSSGRPTPPLDEIACWRSRVLLLALQRGAPGRPTRVDRGCGRRRPAGGSFAAGQPRARQPSRSGSFRPRCWGSWV